MKHKMITLCDRSHEAAKQKANFSRWVRKQLLADANNTPSEVVALLTFWHTVAEGLMRKHGEDFREIIGMMHQPEALAQWLFKIESESGFY